MVNAIFTLKSQFYFHFWTPFWLSFIRIRIPNTDPDPGEPFQNVSTWIRIRNTGINISLFLYYLILCDLSGKRGVVEENADLLVRHTRHGEADPTTEDGPTVKRILPLEWHLYSKMLSYLLGDTGTWWYYFWCLDL